MQEELSNDHSFMNMPLDGARQKLDCWHSANISTIAVIHDIYFSTGLSPESNDLGGFFQEF